MPSVAGQHDIHAYVHTRTTWLMFFSPLLQRGKPRLDAVDCSPCEVMPTPQSPGAMVCVTSRIIRWATAGIVTKPWWVLLMHMNAEVMLNTSAPANPYGQPSKALAWRNQERFTTVYCMPDIYLAS
jgi:hypothetical protein